MFNISKNLLDISKGLKKDEFDMVKSGFKQIVFDVSTIDLKDEDFVLDTRKFKLKTLGSKKVRLAMCLEEIQKKLQNHQILKDFTLVL